MFGCHAVEPEDGAFDSFADGKADGDILNDGSPEALAVIALANSATFDQLDTEVVLSSRAARNIVDYRDGAGGTDDDETFDSLGEIDDVPYVGPLALELLLDYAVEQGLVPAGSLALRATTASAALVTMVDDAKANNDNFLVKLGAYRYSNGLAPSLDQVIAAVEVKFDAATFDAEELDWHTQRTITSEMLRSGLEPFGLDGLETAAAAFATSAQIEIGNVPGFAQVNGYAGNAQLWVLHFPATDVVISLVTISII